MKKKMVWICVFLTITFSFTACMQNSVELEEWQKPVIGISIADEQETWVNYYRAAINGDLPPTKEENEVLKMYQELHPKEFELMINPIIVRIDEKNIILYSDSEGNIYSSESKEVIGQL